MSAPWWPAAIRATPMGGDEIRRRLPIRSSLLQESDKGQVVGGPSPLDRIRIVCASRLVPGATPGMRTSSQPPAPLCRCVGST